MELPYHTKAGTIKTASQKIQKKSVQWDIWTTLSDAELYLEGVLIFIYLRGLHW